MAKQIIILSRTQGPGGDQDVTALFWFAVTASQQVAIPNVTTLWRGATQAELSALRAGTVVERIYRAQYPVGFTLAQIESALVTAYGDANTVFQALPNPNQFYGTSWDGATWTASGALPPGNVSQLSFGSQTISGTGDSIIIPGVAGQSIAIVQMQLAAAGNITVVVKDGASAIGGYAMTVGEPVILPATDFPWFVTSAGANFVLNLSANAINVIVSGWYRQA